MTDPPVLTILRPPSDSLRKRGAALTLLPSTDVSPELYNAVRVELAARLILPVHPAHPVRLPDALHDDTREQCAVADLLSFARQQVAYGAVILLTDVDVYAEHTAFVSGAARDVDRTMVVAVHRMHRPYDGPQYDDGPDPLIGRTVGEAIRQIGHLLGLQDCTAWYCVMHPEPDTRGTLFCPSCWAQNDVAHIFRPVWRDVVMPAPDAEVPTTLPHTTCRIRWPRIARLHNTVPPPPVAMDELLRSRPWSFVLQAPPRLPQ